MENLVVVGCVEMKNSTEEQNTSKVKKTLFNKDMARKRNIMLLSLFICSLGYSQIQWDSIDSLDLSVLPSYDWPPLDGQGVPLNSNSESITRIEVANDSLYVYKSIQPNSSYGCLVFHDGEPCSWNQDRNVRDVYALVDGKMKMVKTQYPKYKTVKKEVSETIEYWGN